MTWVRGYPIYAVHFVVVILVFAMATTAVFMNRQASFWLAELPFRSDLVLGGEIWRLFSYGFVQVPDSVWIVIDYIFLVWFGREVERHVGRKTFFWLYGWIYLTPPLLLTALGLWYPFSLRGGTGALAIFVSFATFYPSVTLTFNIMAKWAAIILVAAYSFVHFAHQLYAQLLALWVSCSAAFLFTRHHQGLLELPRLRLWRRKPKLRVLPDLKPARPERTEKPAYVPALKPDSMAEVDALLDKIAKSGISSLTAKERAKLEAAREGLLKRGRD